MLKQTQFSKQIKSKKTLLLYVLY